MSNKAEGNNPEFRINPSSITFEDKYKIINPDKILGQGCSSIVKLCQKIPESEDYIPLMGAGFSKKAVKIVRNDDEEYLRNSKKEFALLNRLDHPGIVQMHELFMNKQKMTLYFVMDYIEGPTMTEYLNQKGKLGEAEALKHFSEILNIVEYLHSCGICHRDLNPNNLILEAVSFQGLSADTTATCTTVKDLNEDIKAEDFNRKLRKQSSQMNVITPLTIALKKESLNLVEVISTVNSSPKGKDHRFKLIDFNAAKRFVEHICNTPNKEHKKEQKQLKRLTLSTKTGFMPFRAPELLGLHQNYDEAVDLWSLGACLFFMLTGSYPFSGSSEIQVCENILDIKIDTELKAWKAISENTKTLVLKLMCKREQRSSINEIRDVLN